MAKFVVPILLLCLASPTALAQYGRPRSSSSGGYDARGNGVAAGGVLRPTSKPSSTGGYGGSYGGIYNNPSSSVEEIEPLDEELEEVEQPEPVQPQSGPAPVRGGYGTFRPSANQFNGVRYAPDASPAAPRAPSGRPSSVRPPVEEEVNDESLDEPLDELDAPASVEEVIPSRPSGSAFTSARPTATKPKSRTGGNYGSEVSRSFGPSSQFGAQGSSAQTLGQRRQNAAAYGGSLPQLFASNEDNNQEDAILFPEEAPVDGEIDLQEIDNNNQFAPATSSANKKRPTVGVPAVSGNSAQSFGSLLGGSIPSYAPAQGQFSSSTRSGYGSSRASSLGSSNNGVSQGPINAAVQSTHNVEFRDVPSQSDTIEPITIEVAPNQNEIQLLFKSASSNLNIESAHEASPGSFSETNSEDEAHVLKHTVNRPIYQEIRELITPTRKILQEIQPVQEEVQTIVARGTGRASSKSLNGVTGAGAAQRQTTLGGGKAKSSNGAQRSSSSGDYGNGGRSSGSSLSTGYGSNLGSSYSTSKQSPTETLTGFNLAQLAPATTKPASWSNAKAKAKSNGGAGYGSSLGSNGQTQAKLGQAHLSMSFNYGPASTSYDSDSGLTSSRRDAPKAFQSNGKAKNGAHSIQQARGGYGSTFSEDSKSFSAPSNSNKARGGYGSTFAGKSVPFSAPISSGKARGGYGSTFTDDSTQFSSSSGAGKTRGSFGSAFTDDNQSTSSVKVDRVGNGVAYQMMTFTMGTDAMKKQRLLGASAQQSAAPSSSTRSGYGSSRGSSLGPFSGSNSGARNGKLFAASAEPSLKPLAGGKPRRPHPSARPGSSVAAIIDDELENGEIDVDILDEPAAAAATGGAFVSTAGKMAARASGYRGQLGQTRSSYKRAAAAGRAA